MKVEALLLSITVIAFSKALTAPDVLYTKVAILGGGVSAISAALNLTASGINDFMIIEARDSLGGRAQDVPFAGHNVELGCNWVQGLGTNPINHLRKKYKLKTAVSDGDNVLFYDEHGKANFSEIYERYKKVSKKMDDMAFKRLSNKQVDLSGRAGLDMAGWFPKTALEQAIENYVYDWELGENPEMSSLLYSAINNNWTYTGFGPGSDGDLMVIDPRGFKYIFLEEAKTALKENDPRVKLNTRIIKVVYGDDGVTILTNRNLVVKADYAISTFSIGVLQNHDVDFVPAMPEWKLEGIYGFHMATYTKIFFNFPHQFWEDNEYSVWADPDQRGYYSVWQNLNAPGYFPKNTSSNIFFVTLTQQESYRAEAMSDKEVQEQAMTVLRKMYGKDIPEPTEFTFPRWHTNSLFRGSYSNWPIGELSQHHVNMKAPLKNRLFFAGEAMSKNYFGFLQGAWFSGEETATAITQCIKKKCPIANYYPVITNPTIKPDHVK